MIAAIIYQFLGVVFCVFLEWIRVKKYKLEKSRIKDIPIFVVMSLIWVVPALSLIIDFIEGKENGNIAKSIKRFFNRKLW